MLLLSIGIVVASIALLLHTLRLPFEDGRRLLMGGFSTLLLGFVLLAGGVIPKGTVRDLTQLVFVLGALLFIVMEVRLGLANRRRP